MYMFGTLKTNCDHLLFNDGLTFRTPQECLPADLSTPGEWRILGCLQAIVSKFEWAVAQVGTDLSTGCL
jgi:hypothetical protein